MTRAVKDRERDNVSPSADQGETFLWRKVGEGKLEWGRGVEAPVNHPPN